MMKYKNDRVYLIFNYAADYCYSLQNNFQKENPYCNKNCIASGISLEFKKNSF